MKRVLIIVMIFLAIDCHSARRLEDVDDIVLDEKRANGMLVYSGYRPYRPCSDYQDFARQNVIKPLWGDIDVHEECCNEGCNTEEMAEIINTNIRKAERAREQYRSKCC